MNDLITVIVPIYNVEYYLDVCLNSIIMQTYENFELILVDDGSTDKSGAICDRYAKRDGRITVIHQKNGGVSATRNAALKQAHGKYVCFVDSDDILPRNSIRILYDTLRETDSQYCQGTISYILPRKNTLCNSILVKEAYRQNQDEWRDYIFTLNWGPVASLFETGRIRRLKLGFMTNVKIYEDSIFLASYLNACDHVCSTSETVYYYNLLNESLATHGRRGYEELWKWSSLFADETSLLFNRDYKMRIGAIEELTLRDLHFVLTYYETRSEYFGKDKVLALVEQTCNSMLPNLNGFYMEDLRLPLSVEKCNRYREAVLSRDYEGIINMIQNENEVTWKDNLRHCLAQIKKFLLFKARIINLN